LHPSGESQVRLCARGRRSVRATGNQGTLISGETNMLAIRLLTVAVVFALVALSECGAAERVSGGGALDVAAYLDLVDQAKARSTAKQWAQAAELWEKAVTLNPVDVKLWSQLGAARYNARDFDGAIVAYEKVLELGADLPSLPAYNIACCHALGGNKEQAI